MNDLELVRQKQRLDALFEKVRQLHHDAELQAHWSRYLCVLVSGFIENGVEIVLSKYAEIRADQRTSRFVAHHVRAIQNPRMNKVLEMVGMFGVDWKEELRSATDGELKDAIDSIVANRHLIAHGTQTGISYATIKDYYRRVIPSDRIARS